MFQITLSLMKWLSLPVLLIASPFSEYAVSYESLLDSVVCLAAIIFSAQWAFRSKEYFWAAGFVGIAVLFSPILMLVKIFMLIGLACLVTSATLVAAFQTQPALAQHS